MQIQVQEQAHQTTSASLLKGLRKIIIILPLSAARNLRPPLLELVLPLFRPRITLLSLPMSLTNCQLSAPPSCFQDHIKFTAPPSVSQNHPKMLSSSQPTLESPNSSSLDQPTNESSQPSVLLYTIVLLP